MKVTSLEKLSIESIKLSEGMNDGKLVLQIKAIHNGMTRNLTNYTSEALKGSIDSWTQPYQRKVLKNHDIDAEPLGRVLAATYSYDDIAHKDAVMLTTEIVDPDAIQKVHDKRYTTVSVGGTSTSVLCSICNTDIAKEGLCEHQKGEFYDGDLAFWNIMNFEPDEVSFVNAPADMFAGVAEVLDNPALPPSGSNVFNQSVNNNSTGLQENNHNKGGHIMTIEDVQAQLATSEASLATKTTELATKSAELETKTTEATESATKIEEINAQIVTMTEQLATLNTEKDTLVTEKTTLTESNETLTAEVGSTKAEKEAIEAQVIEVRTSNHRLVAEKIATAKLFLGKITKDTYEAEVDELAKRTVESLNDSITDLMGDLASTIVVEHVEDPTKKDGLDNGIKESKEFESKHEFSSYLDSEISTLFR